MYLIIRENFIVWRCGAFGNLFVLQHPSDLRLTISSILILLGISVLLMVSELVSITTSMQNFKQNFHKSLHAYIKCEYLSVIQYFNYKASIHKAYIKPT